MYSIDDIEYACRSIVVDIGCSNNPMSLRKFLISTIESSTNAIIEKLNELSNKK